jgi:hypothetical protein
MMRRMIWVTSIFASCVGSAGQDGTDRAAKSSPVCTENQILQYW